ncbi:MAG: helicase, partial [Alkalimonas sp.]|nr:helicase [Alkalimonas sp.]
MTTVNNQILSANQAICQNIELLADQRKLLSQNVLSQLRNLVEGIVVRLHTGSSEAVFNYDKVGPALDFIRGKGKLNFLTRFHKLIQKSASHYTLDGDNSERLMLKYYEYLHRVRNLLRNEIGIEVLGNLEAFPVDLDPSLREYHEKIAERIETLNFTSESKHSPERYYIHKTRPFFCNGQIYYEVTFYRAINKVNKFDRIIAFTNIDIADKHAAMLTLQRDSIQVIGQTMPITIIRYWEVSIRPCELDNFARLMGISLKARTNSAEYKHIMHCLTTGVESLLDIIDMSDKAYQALRAAATVNTSSPQIFRVLDEARQRIKSSSPGHNVLRYLMLNMHNQILKLQYCRDSCERLSNLKLKYACTPFDDMPFCTSLSGPLWQDSCHYLKFSQLGR